MEDHHYSLLELTEEEIDLLLRYIRQPAQFCELDPAKFLKAASVLFRKVPPQSISVRLLTEITQSVINLLQKDFDNTIMESVIYLLWTLCHVPEIKNSTSKVESLTLKLMSLQESSCSIVSSPARSLLWQLGHGSYEDPEECCLYAFACLHYAFYAECIDWCDRICANFKSTFNGRVNLIRGKAYAHIHKRQMWIVMRNGLLDVTVPWKTGDVVDQCASHARKATGDLGLALDHGVLDEDGSYLMDLAMINHVIIKKQLKDCQRCLLCRRRGVKLKESHTFPKFFLKEITNQARSGVQNLELDPEEMGIGEFFRAGGGQFRIDTSNTAMKYTLLCERCEQCLSQNGEDQFRKDFLPHIYSDSDEVQSVTYTADLYNFCMGILFRSFVNNAFVFYVNADEIYSLLVVCRQHLVQLPVKLVETKVVPDPPPINGLKCFNLPDTYIILNPALLHVPNSNLLTLAATMISGCNTWFLITPLNKEPKTRLCHALVVHMGTCNIIVPFSPARNALSDIQRILPQGGMYPVLPEISRWSGTPQGVFKAISEHSLIMSRKYQQVLSGMKTTKGKSKKADNVISVVEKISSSLSLEEGPIDISSLYTPSIPPEEIELISLFVSKSPSVAEILPEGFHLTLTPPRLSLKEGYILLNHVYDKDTDNTLFFASTSSDIANGNLIVLMSVKEEAESYTRVEGVYVQIKIDGSICVTGHLQEPFTQKMKESQHNVMRLSKSTARAIKAVDTLLQRYGSPNMFIFYESIQTRYQNRVSLRYGCSPSGCWYCKNCCHICMEPANQGYALFPSKGVMFKHCSEDCKAIVDNAAQFLIKVNPMLIFGYDVKTLILMSSEGCFSSLLSTYTVAQVVVCISIDSASTQGRPFAIIQLRSVEQQFILSAYLANDFSPIEPVYDIPPGFSFDSLKDNDILSHVLKSPLQNKGIYTISHLFMEAVKVDASIAQYFCITLDPRDRLSLEDACESASTRLSHEKSLNKWMIEHITARRATPTDEHQVQALEGDFTHLPLLPSTGTLSLLFWSYFQSACTLWKEVMTDVHSPYESLMRKLDHVIHVTTLIYEQSPQDVQSSIISKFSVSSENLFTSEKVAIMTCEGCLFGDLNVRFLVLISKLAMAPECKANEVMSIVISKLFHDFVSITQHDENTISDASALAHHLLLTLLLRALQGGHTSWCKEFLSAINGYVQSLMTSHYTLVSVLAKAVAVCLQSCCPQSVSTGLTHEEADIISLTLVQMSEDSIKRKYSSIVYQCLLLLCSHPSNLDLFIDRNVVDDLQTLMEYSTEVETDIIANVVWKIASRGDVCAQKGSDDVTDSHVDQDIKEEPSPTELDVTLSRSESQGFQCILDSLFLIVKEFIILHLNCKEVPHAQAHTAYTAVQLLTEICHILETKEISQWTNVFLNAANVELVVSSISKYSQVWRSIPNGIPIVTAIESLLYTWASCSKKTCHLLIRSGCLNNVDCFELASTFGTLQSHDTERLLNRVGLIFKCAKAFPMQVAFQMEHTEFQPMLNCSIAMIRVLSKSILAFIAKYRKIPNLLEHICLQNKEVVLITSRLGRILPSEISSSSCEIFSDLEDILFSLRSLTSYPSNKRHCALPILLDKLISLCLSDMNVAILALETLWNLSFDPTVALAILNHENAVCTLKSLVFHSSLATLSASMLWTLGCKRTLCGAGCCDYIHQCYSSGKYDEVVIWCDHLLQTMKASDPLVLSVKSYKGKSIAQKYLTKQVNHLIGNDDWALLGYDSNCGTFKAVNQRLSNDSQEDGKELLRHLSLYDMHSWKDLCSQGLLAINLLGEVLDSNELDREGAELLDLVLMDYCKEAGETSQCKRCLLCRAAGDLVPTRLKSLTDSGADSVPESDSSSSDSFDRNVFILRSYMYITGLQTNFMFCQECLSLLSYYCGSYLQFILEAIDPIKEKTIEYDNNVYTCLIGYLAQNLPLIIANYTSNWKEIYAAFCACRQILLSHEKTSSLATFPKMYFLVNPLSWHMFNTFSYNMYQLSPNLRNITALVADQQSTLNGGDSHKSTLFWFHTGVWNIVLDFGSESELPSSYLIHQNGGTYTIPSMKQRWEILPLEFLRVFHDLTQADEHRGASRSILNAEKIELTRPSGTSLPLVSYSARFLLPCQRVVSFLPKQFIINKDSDNNIKSVSVPDGHMILGHTHNSEKEITFILACASDYTTHQKRFYYIVICKLWGYTVIEGVFLKGKLSMSYLTTSPILFPMYPSLGIQEIVLVRRFISKKITLDLKYFMTSLLGILCKYGHFDFNAASNYVDAIRNIDVGVSVDTKCSSEGCWYCRDRCHNCFRESSIGYAHKTAEGGQLYHCSKRCYHMHTADIDDATVIDASVGKDNIQHGCGTQLLFNATVNLHTGLSKNTAISAQLCVSFNDKDIPSGVVYVNILLCTTEVHLNPLALFIDHDLCPVKSVWSSIKQDVVEMWKEKALVKRALTPALESIGCKNLITLLTTRFPSSIFSFMDTDQRIYSITKNGEKTYATTSKDQKDDTTDPLDCIHNIQ